MRPDDREDAIGSQVFTAIFDHDRVGVTLRGRATSRILLQIAANTMTSGIKRVYDRKIPEHDILRGTAYPRRG